MRIQEWIYQLEEGNWFKYLKNGAIILAALAVLVVYNLREFKNFSSPEAMDMAQLARNISEGKGYTTDFVRPLSIYLLTEQGMNPEDVLKKPHPDLANPPVYPVLLAGLMKVLPFDYDLEADYKFESRRYQPEVLIGWFNQLLFFVCVFLVYRLGIRLFDKEVAFLAAALFFGAELFWRFSVSGQSTIWLILVFLLLLGRLIAMEQAEREEKHGRSWFIIMAALAGLLLGIGALSRYAFAWMVIPVFVYLISFTGRQKWAVAPVALGVFLLVFTPWLLRNYHLSGHFFGTSGYAVAQGTAAFEGNRLERSLKPNFEQVAFQDYLKKFMVNFTRMVREELPRLGGSWLGAFFLVSLLIPFQNPSLRRLRVFLVISFVTLMIAQSLGRTHLSDLSPEVNSENLLVLLAPVAFLFGVALFFILLDQLNLEFEGLRKMITLMFALVISAPLVLTFLPPRASPLVYPPYYPPRIQEAGHFFQENELILTDMPWAMAWYGDRQSLWLTLNPTDQFDDVDLFLKPISALYLTELTLNKRFLDDLVMEEKGWGKFIVDSLIRREQLPENFPLKKALSDYLPFQFLLADRKRW